MIGYYRLLSPFLVKEFLTKKGVKKHLRNFQPEKTHKISKKFKKKIKK